MATRVGIEIGGTFTDLVAVADDGQVTTAKVLSTPGRPEQGALAALGEWAGAVGAIASLVHGSTVATNAVIERKGASTLLLTTAGHGDVLEIQRHDKSDIFDLYYRPPTPLLERARVVEVEERLDAEGAVVEPLRLDEGLAARLEEAGCRLNVTSIAVSLLHSYRAAEHEEALAAWLAERHPAWRVSLSSQVDPQYREYERASTTAINAYLRPVVEDYLGAFESSLRERGLTGRVRIMQSSGGIIPIEGARERAVNVVLSGPAAGVVGAVHMGRATGVADFITLDMGGTSADVCLVRGGRADLAFENAIDGLPIRTPTFDIQVVGAGGGSIAWIDDAGQLRVGPQSAGADPGPCCYGRGGREPTTTDANALLGILRPERFFGGKLTLDLAAAEAGLAGVAGALAVPTLALAEGIRRIANANMAETIRLVSVERGHDPRDFALLAFGGAGGLHVCDIARALQISTAVVPEQQGVLSALGLLASDFSINLVRSLLLGQADFTTAAVAAAFDDLGREALEQFERYGVESSGAAVHFSVDMRYAGQASELNVPVEEPPRSAADFAAWIERFHALYRRRFGHSLTANPVQLVNVRAVAVRPAGDMRLQGKASGPPVAGEPGRIYCEGAWRDARFFWRPDLPAGQREEGPLVVEDLFATTYVPPGWRMEVHASGSLLLTDRQERDEPAETGA